MDMFDYRDSEMRARILNAVARQYTTRGFEVLEFDWSCEVGIIPLVVRNQAGNTLVFVDVEVETNREKGFPPPRVPRAIAERLLIEYLASGVVNLGWDMGVRFDFAGVLVVGEGDGAVRIQPNILWDAGASCW